MAAPVPVFVGGTAHSVADLLKLTDNPLALKARLTTSRAFRGGALAAVTYSHLDAAWTALPLTSFDLVPTADLTTRAQAADVHVETVLLIDTEFDPLTDTVERPVARVMVGQVCVIGSDVLIAEVESTHCLVLSASETQRFLDATMGLPVEPRKVFEAPLHNAWHQTHFPVTLGPQGTRLIVGPNATPVKPTADHFRYMNDAKVVILRPLTVAIIKAADPLGLRVQKEKLGGGWTFPQLDLTNDLVAYVVPAELVPEKPHEIVLKIDRNIWLSNPDGPYGNVAKDILPNYKPTTWSNLSLHSDRRTVWANLASDPAAQKFVIVIPYNNESAVRATACVWNANAELFDLKALDPTVRANLVSYGKTEPDFHMIEELKDIPPTRIFSSIADLVAHFRAKHPAISAVLTPNPTTTESETIPDVKELNVAMAGIYAELSQISAVQPFASQSFDVMYTALLSFYHTLTDRFKARIAPDLFEHFHLSLDSLLAALPVWVAHRVGGLAFTMRPPYQPDIAILPPAVSPEDLDGHLAAITQAKRPFEMPPLVQCEPETLDSPPAAQPDAKDDGGFVREESVILPADALYPFSANFDP